MQASGDGALSYQWQKGGNNLTNGGRITGADAATLQITGIQPSDAASYRCVVTGGCGSANTIAVALTIQVSVPADFDADSDVDMDDWAVLQRCLDTLDAAGNPTCLPTDLNGDNAVDGLDAGLFVGCLSGTNIPGNANCLGG